MAAIVSITKTGTKTVTVTFDSAVTAASATAGSFYLTYNSGSPIAATSVSQNGTNALDVTAASWPTDPTGSPYWIKGDDSTAFYAGVLTTTQMGFVANTIGAALLAAVNAAVVGDTITLGVGNYDIGDGYLAWSGSLSLFGAGKTSSTITSHYIGTFTLNASAVTSITHACLSPGTTSNIGSLTLLCPETFYRNINVINGAAKAAVGSFQKPFGISTADTPLTGTTVTDVNIVGQTDCIYFNDTVSNDITMSFIRVNCTSNFDTFNNLGTSLTGTVTLQDCIFNASGPDFTGSHIVRGIHCFKLLVINAINTQIFVAGASTDHVWGVYAQHGTVNLTGAGSITILSGGTQNSLMTDPADGTINVNSQTVIYDQTLTVGRINGTIGGLAATVSDGTTATVTWTAFTGASYYTGTLNSVDQGTITNGSNFTLTSSSDNTMVVTAFDTANKHIAASTVIIQPNLSAAEIAARVFPVGNLSGNDNWTTSGTSMAVVHNATHGINVSNQIGDAGDEYNTTPIPFPLVSSVTIEFDIMTIFQNGQDFLLELLATNNAGDPVLGCQILMHDSGVSECRIYADNSGTNFPANDPVFVESIYQHWKLTYDGTLAKIYVDGVEKVRFETSFPHSGVPISDTTKFALHFIAASETSTNRVFIKHLTIQGTSTPVARTSGGTANAIILRIV